MRIMLESKAFESHSFVTLTYRDDTVPEEITYKHFQDYMKRLRKSSPDPIRFFCVGEYGKHSTKRPHWHAILLGYQFPLKETDRFVKNGARVTLHEPWQDGTVVVGEVNPKTIGYTVRYTLKSSTKYEHDPHVVRMSKSIGKEYMISIGEEMARRVDRAVIPSALQYQKRWWPLHKTCREWIRDGFRENGGIPIYSGHEGLESDAKLMSLLTGEEIETLASQVRINAERRAGLPVISSFDEFVESEAKRHRMKARRGGAL